MSTIRDYELMLSDRSTVIWSGEDGADAARRYVETHPKARVIATRNYPRTGVFNARPDQIIEPTSRA